MLIKVMLFKHLTYQVFVEKVMGAFHLLLVIIPCSNYMGMLITLKFFHAAKEMYLYYTRKTDLLYKQDALFFL